MCTKSKLFKSIAISFCPLKSQKLSRMRSLTNNVMQASRKWQKTKSQQCLDLQIQKHH